MKEVFGSTCVELLKHDVLFWGFVDRKRWNILLSEVLSKFPEAQMSFPRACTFKFKFKLTFKFKLITLLPAELSLVDCPW